MRLRDNTSDSTQGGSTEDYIVVGGNLNYHEFDHQASHLLLILEPDRLTDQTYHLHWHPIEPIIVLIMFYGRGCQDHFRCR